MQTSREQRTKKISGKDRHKKLTGLGIASGSILCLDFCTAGMSDACFTIKSLSGKLCKTGQK